jgi:hypothetical protein
MRLVVSILASLVFGTASLASGQASRLPATKKLIEYGWDVPTPAFVRDHIQEMERRPFDGLMMRLAGGNRGKVFHGGAYKDEDFAADFEALKAIQWKKFQDNFLMMYAASNMDWFSDQDWQWVLHNVSLMARAAKAGKCHLTFDAEPYGFDPWHYPSQKHAKTKSFADYRAIARQRGAQFMTAIQQELPHAVVHTFFTFSYAANLVGKGDPYDALENHHYGLYFDFLNGMLSAAGPGVTLTDGNERSYYYQNSESFFRSYHAMRQTGLALVERGNVPKFLLQTQAAQALYVDHLFDLRKRTVLSRFMTPGERAKWFQHNVYWAMTTADEFVWLYSEKMNWWKNQVPDGLEDAVLAAREKLDKHHPLGYTMDDIILRAKKREKDEMAKLLIKREAKVKRMAAAPSIDGVLQPKEWAAATALPAFVPYVGTKGKPSVATTGYVGYDDRFLYIGVNCGETVPDKIVSAGTKRDETIWLGDSIDVFVSKQASGVPFAHFILAPNNTQWDAEMGTVNDLAWNPEWQSRTAIGKAAWTAEIAIPWKSLGITPKSGLKLRANVCRQRLPVKEYATWSQCVSGFPEADHFGTWVLE